MSEETPKRTAAEEAQRGRVVTVGMLADALRETGEDVCEAVINAVAPLDTRTGRPFRQVAVLVAHALRGVCVGLAKRIETP